MGLSVEERLRNWIQAIADDPQTTYDDVVQHIYKHVTTELMELHGSPEVQQRWLASMDNLLDITRTLLNVKQSPEIRLQRLQEQVEKYPDRRTPEPVAKEQPCGPR